MAAPLIGAAMVGAAVIVAESLSRKSTGKGVVQNLSDIFTHAGNALEQKGGK